MNGLREALALVEAGQVEWHTGIGDVGGFTRRRADPERNYHLLIALWEARNEGLLHTVGTVVLLTDKGQRQLSTKETS